MGVGATHVERNGFRRKTIEFSLEQRHSKRALKYSLKQPTITEMNTQPCKDAEQSSDSDDSFQFVGAVSSGGDIPLHSAEEIEEEEETTLVESARTLKELFDASAAIDAVESALRSDGAERIEEELQAARMQASTPLPLYVATTLLLEEVLGGEQPQEQEEEKGKFSSAVFTLNRDCAISRLEAAAKCSKSISEAFQMMNAIDCLAISRTSALLKEMQETKADLDAAERAFESLLRRKMTEGIEEGPLAAPTQASTSLDVGGGPAGGGGGEEDDNHRNDSRLRMAFDRLNFISRCSLALGDAECTRTAAKECGEALAASINAGTVLDEIAARTEVENGKSLAERLRRQTDKIIDIQGDIGVSNNALRRDVTERIEEDLPSTRTQASTPQPTFIVELDVGGQKFSTSLSTLTRVSDSLLARLFAVGKGGAELPRTDLGYFIDRDPKLFGSILNALRASSPAEISALLSPPICSPAARAALRIEAEHFGLTDFMFPFEPAQPTIILDEVGHSILVTQGFDALWYGQQVVSGGLLTTSIPLMESRIHICSKNCGRGLIVRSEGVGKAGIDQVLLLPGFALGRKIDKKQLRTDTCPCCAL